MMQSVHHDRLSAKAAVTLRTKRCTVDITSWLPRCSNANKASRSHSESDIVGVTDTIAQPSLCALTRSVSVVG